MVDSLNIKRLPPVEIIQEVATELGVLPSFVEKDWYVVQVIKIIAKVHFEGILPVFSGGTSLSKGHNIIKRFSEDIDFKLKTCNGNPSRTRRSKFRNEFIDQIKSLPIISVDESSLKVKNESKFFSFNILYPQQFNLGKSLRPNLKLEMVFNEIYLDTEKKTISSFVADYTNQDNEALIECISSIETAADKLSALLWRVVNRYYLKKGNAKKNDPNMIRHLHDISALKELILKDSKFFPTFKKIFPIDCKRFKTHNDVLNFHEIIQLTLNQLYEDKTYSFEYKRFVDAMFYGPDNEQISFTEAIQSLQEIVDFIKSQELLTVLTVYSKNKL